MIIAPYYCGKTVGVFGLARTGVAAVQTLMSSGADVWAWDDNPASCQAVGDAAVDLYKADFTKMDYLLLAPGVPFQYPEPHELITKALSNGVSIIGDMDIFEKARKEMLHHKVVAITGTNGKSTTSALIAHILEHADRPVALGGNIGTGVLSLDPIDEGGVYVLEVSSYQIDLMKEFSADIAVLLNITPDHLDRHGDMQGYVKAKGHLFELQDIAATAISSFDDEFCLSLMGKVKAKLLPISVTSKLRYGYSFVDDKVIFADGVHGFEVDEAVNWPTLKGVHNAQNAIAAAAVCLTLGLGLEEIRSGLKSFPGLAHRQEHITAAGDILFVNDSKATNVEAASKALASFKNIRWIAGGRMKETTLAGLYDQLENVKTAYLIGEDADKFAIELDGKVPYEVCGQMDEAVNRAAMSADAGDVVLLSPACAAFDQYNNFEVRGDAFRAYVMGLDMMQNSEKSA